MSDPAAPDLLEQSTAPAPGPLVGPQTDTEKAQHLGRLKKALALPDGQLQDLALTQLKQADDAWKIAVSLPDTYAPGPVLLHWYPQAEGKIMDALAEANRLKEEAQQLQDQTDPKSQAQRQAHLSRRHKLLAEVYLRAYYTAEPAQLAIAVDRAGKAPVTLGGRYEPLFQQLLEVRRYLITGQELPTNGSPRSLIRQVRATAEELQFQKLQGAEVWRYLVEVPEAIKELPQTMAQAGAFTGEVAGGFVGGAVAGTVKGADEASGGALQGLGWKIALTVAGLGAVALAVLMYSRRSTVVQQAAPRPGSCDLEEEPRASRHR